MDLPTLAQVSERAKDEHSARLKVARLFLIENPQAVEAVKARVREEFAKTRCTEFCVAGVLLSNAVSKAIGADACKVDEHALQEAAAELAVGYINESPHWQAKFHSEDVSYFYAIVSPKGYVEQ